MQLLREEEYREGQDYFFNISMGLFEKSLFPWMPVSEAFLLEHDMLQKLKRKKTAFRCRLKEGLSQELGREADIHMDGEEKQTVIFAYAVGADGISGVRELLPSDLLRCLSGAGLLFAPAV